MIPVHMAHTVLETDFSRTIIKAHILSGNDCLSKVGSKHAAIVLNPVQYLVNFADGILTDQDIALAERYLVRVWAGVRSTTTAETFDELRLEAYLKGTGLDSLPPTSSVIRGHIHRGAYLINKSCKLLEDKQYEQPDNALEHGWIEKIGVFLPSKCFKYLPEKFLQTCKCAGNCETKRCKCKAAGVKCTMYCHSKNSSEPCINNREDNF